MTAGPNVDDAVELHPLDDAVRLSLSNEHERFAVRSGRIVRYHPDVAPFVHHPAVIEDDDWADIVELVGADTPVPLRGDGYVLPPGWEVVGRMGGVQMDGSGLDVASDPDVYVLTAEDVPEILALIDRAKPGPFRTRTIELGTYLGIRIDDRLVAMAGERMHPPGWTEISAVCTDERYRGLGLATRLVRAVGAVIRSRGEIPFLHAAESNTGAIRLYEQLGFTLRKRSESTIVRTGPIPTGTEPR